MPANQLISRFKLPEAFKQLIIWVMARCTSAQPLGRRKLTVALLLACLVSQGFGHTAHFDAQVLNIAVSDCLSGRHAGSLFPKAEQPHQVELLACQPNQLDLDALHANTHAYILPHMGHDARCTVPAAIVYFLDEQQQELNYEWIHITTDSPPTR
jgi:hypothetical protein